MMELQLLVYMDFKMDTVWLKIVSTTNYRATIDGFLTKNVQDITLLKKPYDHSAVFCKL